jgi:uncharacterized protein YjbI with pentapeptide repeats
MKFKVYNRWSGDIQFTAEIKAGANNSEYMKLGLAVRWAHETGASLVGANLVGASLVGASLVGASLDGANLVGANLDGASLVGASLDGANLDGASLVGANLVGANLIGASLDGASLVGASLVGANLIGANLDGANLDGANLDGASLVGASLVGANLVGASLVGASLDGKAVHALLGRVTRNDGYEFLLWQFRDGSHVIKAGCRTYTIERFRGHVAAQYPDTDKARETLAILDYLERRLADAPATPGLALTESA